MTRKEIIKFLVKECHVDPLKVGKLNDVQIQNLCSPDRKAPGQQ